MSVQLHPAIKELDPGSLCYSIYSGLYHHFFNAQDKACISEGDETSVRLRNTAYNFADAIAGGVAGEGSGSNPGGILLEYLKKSGGDMTGMLRANYGFEAGFGNNRIIQTYAKQDGPFGVRLNGDVEIGVNNLLIGGSNILSLDSVNRATVLSGEAIQLDSPLVSTQGEIRVINGKEDSVVLDKYGIKINGHTVFHSGNANLSSVDWTMLNANIGGSLTVKGIAELKGKLRAINGMELGDKNEVFIYSGKNKINFSRNLSFDTGYGIAVDNMPVLSNINGKDIQLGGIGGDLLIGSDKTGKVRLLSNITVYNIIEK